MSEVNIFLSELPLFRSLACKPQVYVLQQFDHGIEYRHHSNTSNNLHCNAMTDGPYSFI
jgi:hypothetical protein